MSFVVMGTSYKTAGLGTRELAAGGSADAAVADSLAALAAAEGVREAALLSTCNRVEVYLEATTDRMGEDAATGFFRERMGGAFDLGDFYLRRNAEAVRHVFRVVCSLDSQVLGEAQILGQMRMAYRLAQEAGTAGEVLGHLFKTALHLGKRVRSETAIGAGSVSLSTTAFKAACEEAGDIASAGVLLLGAGEMARLLAKYLADAGARSVRVASWTFAHARRLAGELGADADAVPFDERYEQAALADVVFAMVSSDTAVLEAGELQQAREAAGRADAPLTIVDVGMPRNVEPACGELSGVTLYDQQALDGIVGDGLAERAAAVGEVERLAEEATRGFLAWMQQRLVTPTVKEMYQKGSLVVAVEHEEACRKLAHELGRALTDEEKDLLGAYGRAVMKKLLHGPAVRLRKEAPSADSYYYTAAARYLFGIDAFPPGTRRHHHEEDAR